jgi:uncharacterized Zn finger protein
MRTQTGHTTIMPSFPELTDEQLIDAAGEAAFQRGLAYYDKGRVLEITAKRGAVSAAVSGSHTYRVTLRHNRGQVQGSCDCPASEGMIFCKHCVAVALAFREHATQPQKSTAGRDADSLETFLDTLSPSELKAHLLTLIRQDDRLLQEWSMKADIALGKVDHKALKKRITAALPYNRHLFRYNQVRAYFAKAESAIDMVADELKHLPAETALTLVDYAVQRLARALQTVDDSGGFRMGTEYTLHDAHKEALARLDWPPKKVAEYLHKLAFGDTSDFYPTIPDDYIDVLSKQVLEEYQASIREAWDALPPLPDKANWDRQFHYLCLQRPLLKAAEAAQDFPAQVELLQKTAIEPSDFLDLCKLCMKHDAWDQAEYWLARTRKKQSDRSGNAYVALEADRLQVRLFLHRGQQQEAGKLQWHVFTESLEISDYLKLLELQKPGQEQKMQTQVREYLIAHLDTPQNGSHQQHYTKALLAIYLHENDLNAALELCDQHKVLEHQLLELARRFEAQPVTAKPLYHKLVTSTISQTNNRAYRDAVALLEEYANTLQVPAHHAAFEALVNELRAEHKQKRNFVKYLGEAFPGV